MNVPFVPPPVLHALMPCSLGSVVLAILLTGCGAGAAGAIGAASSGDSGRGNSATVASDLQITDINDKNKPALNSPAAVRFRLTDEEGDLATVRVFFVHPTAAQERPISLHPASGPLTKLPPGDHIVLWDYEADLGASAFDVAVRLEVEGGASPSSLAPVALGNDLKFHLDELFDFSAKITTFSQGGSGQFQENAQGAFTAADVDGNGNLDLISTSPAGDALTIYSQRARGQFAQTTIEISPALGPAAGIRDAFIADMDLDGDQDLLVANQLSDNLFVFFQATPGVFEELPLVISAFGIVDGPVGCLAADMDSDGDMDIVSANQNGNNLAVFFQSAPGSFSPDPLVLGGPSVTLGPVAVLAADLDGNGSLELISVNRIGNNLTIFGLGSQPIQLGGPGTTNSPFSATVADIDGDGDLDLVCAGN